MDWPKLIVLIVCVVLFCWWMSGFSIRNRDSYKRYIDATRQAESHWDAYAESLDVAKESNRIRSEELSILRELIAELRAGRQASAPPPSQPENSN